MSRTRRYESFGPDIMGPLNDDLDDMVSRLDTLEARRETTLTGVTVGTTSTELRHNLGRKPASVIPLGRSDARIWQPYAATETSIFLQASASVVCDVTLRG